MTAATPDMNATDANTQRTRTRERRESRDNANDEKYLSRAYLKLRCVRDQSESMCRFTQIAEACDWRRQRVRRCGVAQEIRSVRRKATVWTSLRRRRQVDDAHAQLRHGFSVQESSRETDRRSRRGSFGPGSMYRWETGGRRCARQDAARVSAWLRGAC
jgi:hypothetical protein